MSNIRLHGPVLTAQLRSYGKGSQLIDKSNHAATKTSPEQNYKKHTVRPLARHNETLCNVSSVSRYSDAGMSDLIQMQAWRGVQR